MQLSLNKGHLDCTGMNENLDTLYIGLYKVKHLPTKINFFFKVTVITGKFSPNKICTICSEHKEDVCLCFCTSPCLN